MDKARAAPETALHRFNRGLYLSLGLACAALAYAEWRYLPETLVLIGFVAISLIVAYRAEGRWSLSLSAANVVGGVIALVMLAWIGFQFVRPGQTLFDLLPWPACLLPYLGPLVLVLIPAKLFRPKHLGDYWALQFFGLMAVALACALEGDGSLGAIVLAYGLLAVRCLTDFSDVRGSFDAGAAARERTPATPWRRSALWAGGGVVAAVILAVVTPRMSDARWDMAGGGRRMTIGYGDDRPTIDLNQSGDLRGTSEVAFEVRATKVDGSAKLDLSPDQRWRGTTFNHYERGRWSNQVSWRQSGPFSSFRDFERPQRNPRERGFAPMLDSSSLPNLGPRQFIVAFKVPRNPNGPFYLAEPVWPPRQAAASLLAPVITETANGGRFSWRATPEGDPLAPPFVPGMSNDAIYRQVTAPLPESGLSAAMPIDPALMRYLCHVAALPALKEFAGQLLDELIRDGKVPPMSNRAGGQLQVDPEHHEAVSRAVEQWLRSSGQFAYSLTLRREDKSLDPVEDFLINMRAGHCNRFSSALALILRTYGVPTRIVLGFQGAELKDDDGDYVVRESQAHSWVEAIVGRPSATGEFTHHWLTLDPTPMMERPDENSIGLVQWLDDLQREANDFLRSYVFDVTVDRQQQVQELLANLNPVVWGPRVPTVLLGLLTTPFGWMLLVAAAAATLWVARHKTRKSGSSGLSAFQRLVAMAGRTGLVGADPAWTPKEWLNRLTSATNDPALVEPAGRIVARQYTCRYGGAAPAPEADRADFAQFRSRLRRR